MIIEMIKKLGREEIRSKKLEVLNKELENIKNNQTELKNTITEMKNTLEGVNSRLNEAGEWISELEDRVVEITAAEDKNEKRLKTNDDSLRDLWDNIKCNNIRIIGFPEEEEREKGPKKIFKEIIVKNFLNIGREIATEVQETQRVLGRINPRRNRPRYIVFKLTKLKTKKNY